VGLPVSAARLITYPSVGARPSTFPCAWAQTSCGASQLHRGDHPV